MAPCAADTASVTDLRKSDASWRQPAAVPVAGGNARQEAGSDEFGAGAAGVLVGAGGAAEGAEGCGAGDVDPHAAMRTAPNGARNGCALGMVKEPLSETGNGAVPDVQG